MQTPRITYFMSPVNHSADIGHWLKTDCIYRIFRTKLEATRSDRQSRSIRFEGDMHISYVSQAYRVSFILKADAEYSDDSGTRSQLERECHQAVEETMQDYLSRLSTDRNSGPHQIPQQISLKKPVAITVPAAPVPRIRLLKSA